MRFKKLLAALTGSAVMLTSLAIPAWSSGGSDFIYQVNPDGNTVTITGCTDYESSSISIPEVIDTYTVTAIAADAFDGGKLGTNFLNLTSVSIPASVTSIDFLAFADCENLSAIAIDQGNTVYSGNADVSVYSADGAILYYVLPSVSNYAVADGTTTIAEKALAYGDELNSIVDITIPASVTTIGDFASVYGDGVTIHGYMYSAAQSFAEANRNNFVAIDQSVFVIEINPDGTTATLVGCTDYTSEQIVIPESVYGYAISSIAASAFDGGKLGTNFLNVRNISIPAAVTSIDFLAFADCENLSEIYVADSNEVYSGKTSNSIYSADESVLYYVLPSAVNYTVADGTTTIAAKALAYGDELNSITDITIPASVTTIGDFAAVYGDGVTIHGNMYSAAQNFAEANRNNFVAVDQSVYIIEINPDNATATIVGCTDYTSQSLEIPDTIYGFEITAIAEGAFDGGKLGTNFLNLASISIPASVTSIDFLAFADCENLNSITVDSENAVYASNADNAVYSADGTTLFYVLPSVSSYTVIDGTITIAAKALAYGDELNSITDITIPASVTSIGDFAAVYGESVTIHGYTETAAESFAESNSNIFDALNAILLGDANCSGFVDVYDALYCLRASVFQEFPTEDNLACGDVYRDGTLDSSDALRILAYLTYDITLEDFLFIPTR